MGTWNSWDQIGSSAAGSQGQLVPNRHWPDRRDQAAQRLAMARRVHARVSEVMRTGEWRGRSVGSELIERDCSILIRIKGSSQDAKMLRKALAPHAEEIGLRIECVIESAQSETGSAADDLARVA